MGTSAQIQLLGASLLQFYDQSCQQFNFSIPDLLSIAKQFTQHYTPDQQEALENRFRQLQDEHSLALLHSTLVKEYKSALYSLTLQPQTAGFLKSQFQFLDALNLQKQVQNDRYRQQILQSAHNGLQTLDFKVSQINQLCSLLDDPLLNEEQSMHKILKLVEQLKRKVIRMPSVEKDYEAKIALLEAERQNLEGQVQSWREKFSDLEKKYDEINEISDKLKKLTGRKTLEEAMIVLLGRVL